MLFQVLMYVVLSQTSPITLEALGQVLTSVGLSATLLLFFVYWLYNSQLRIAKETLDRENRVASEVERRETMLVEDFRTRHATIVLRLEKLEDFNRGALMDLVKETSSTVAANTHAMQNNTAVLERSAKSQEVVLGAVASLHEELRAHDKLARDVAARLKLEKGQ